MTSCEAWQAARQGQQASMASCEAALFKARGRTRAGAAASDTDGAAVDVGAQREASITLRLRCNSFNRSDGPAGVSVVPPLQCGATAAAAPLLRQCCATAAAAEEQAEAGKQTRTPQSANPGVNSHDT